ncbi:Protein O-mannosyltransferase 2 [Coemansia sp. RSA 552]|nr:Protein O-mannosyltransferase 2 [Coemansia sp. RSA 552]
MAARNLKQRGRGGAETAMLVVSDEADHRPEHVAGSLGRGKSYGAYPALQAARHSGPTDLDAVRLGAGVAGMLRSRDFVILVVLTLASLFTRLYLIGRRSKVTWDEAHFGKFGAYYINGTWYHDVHPPLAKMLVGLAEVLSGFNGSFPFKSGSDYPSHVNYRLMRIQLAMYGVALVPLAYLTCLQLRMSRAMAALAACFVLFDNAICVMSRFILLDEPLLFFTATTLLAVAGFQRVNRSGGSFSREWWVWLAATGLSLGCVMSSKWVGLFSVIMVGIATVDDLFRKYCARASWDDLGCHWNARVVTLIFLPLLVYTMCFWVHFRLLYRSGTGERKMSAKFQAQKLGHRLNAQPYDIAFGSEVEIRSMFDGPGLLHSHPDLYPSGSHLQQVTCFPHGDVNNVWQLRYSGTRGATTNYTTAAIEFISDGDIVQLAHNVTGATLQASKQFLAPLTKTHFEVAAGNSTDVDKGTRDWRVETVRQKARRRGDRRVHTMTTVFRLRHVESGCLLRVGKTRLPTWGWGQAEVTCLPDSTHKKNHRGSDVLWYIEHNQNTRLAKDDMSRYVSSNFFIDMVQLNIEMGKSNNALSPDVNKYSALESDPLSWPFLVYPMRMMGWSDDNIKYMEVGNVLLWYGSAIACIIYPLQLLLWAIQSRRRCSRWRSLPEFLDFWDRTRFLWGGYVLHYVPFLFMGRVTYLHHYLPALYFALLLLAFELDFFFQSWRRGRYLNTAALVAGGLSAFVFLLYSPLTYGWDRPAKELKYLNLFETWNIDHDLFAN